MPSYSYTAAALAALSALPLAFAHGHVSSLVSGGTLYTGTTPEWIYQSTKPATPGWYAKNQDNGYVDPASLTGPDIICHKEATPGQTHIPVNAGSPLEIHWNTWPESHKGPVINYLAPCNGDCSLVKKEDLKFFKISESGLIDGSSPPGEWATDNLMANDFTGSVTIPSSIAPGNYVLRHEMIALHSANNEGGAQFYPQCINLKISGSGSATPAGVSATQLYTPTDPGVLVNIYTVLNSYDIPGPAVYSG